ncbi:MAG: DUF4124 domain-containing protein [Gammaproteobacteria bacterium]|nr:DUF4124 domain-containing protein [Gammaproteobacteria bacterium]
MHGLKSVIALAVLLVSAGFATGAVAQTVYKSVDDEGNVAFTDRPPMQQGEDESPLDVMPLQIRLTNPAAIAATRENAEKESRARDMVDSLTAEKQSSDEADDAARKAEERAANCDLARQRLNRYAQANRLYKSNDAGERVYLEDAEIDAERIKAARAVDEWCGG